MSNLVELGYFTSESFFQFVPTAEGLKRPAPSSEHTFNKIDIFTQEEQEYTIDENDYPLNTVYEYLNNYYCLKYMDLAALAGGTDPATKIVLGELPEEPYSYIKQLTIYDSPNALYCIASLDENNQIVRQQYKIGGNGFLQFYNNKIFGVYPSAIVSEYINTGDALLENYAIAVTSGNIASLKRIEMTITTSDFEDSSLILPSPELDLTVIFGQGDEVISSDNKKRTFIDAITLIAQGIVTSSVSGEITPINQS